VGDSGKKTMTMDGVDLLPRPSQEEMRPGVVGIFSQGRPIHLPLGLEQEPIEVGRGVGHGATKLADDRTSRRHTRIMWHGQAVRVTDLGSRNGTFVDGKRVEDEEFPSPPRILRIGNTIFRFTHDIRPFLKGDTTIHDDRVVGPTLREHYAQIARVAQAGETLLLTGPSGSGKELAAQAFHEAQRRGGRFVAVNCATIPTGLAERLLFGARRGAYSGANADAEGYVQTADGGTLFLDEIAELDAGVQAKLLRVLETREVMPLGASEPRKVDIRVCTATLKDLRAEVAAGRFRRDLYYRIGSPEVRLPSIIERLEELPWLACTELQRLDQRLTPGLLFLETIALRPWPGNVRELLRELRNAGRAALGAGHVIVDAADLSPSAGQDIADESGPAASHRDAAPAPPSGPHRDATPTPPSGGDRDALVAALQREHGNVTRAARTLGIHRTQLRRWIARHNIDPTVYSDPESAGDESTYPGEQDQPRKR
jgi:DNA-binding NtrC family response regulator